MGFLRRRFVVKDEALVAFSPPMEKIDASSALTQDKDHNTVCDEENADEERREENLAEPSNLGMIVRCVNSSFRLN